LSDLELVAGRIVHGHLDDMRGATPEEWSVNSDRVIPGDGCLPLRSWYEQVSACGYSGWHAVELFCEDLWDCQPEEIARRTMVGCSKVWPEARF
jgi:sugar phosphate isomerase/epimerase